MQRPKQTAKSSAKTAATNAATVLAQAASATAQSKAQSTQNQGAGQQITLSFASGGSVMPKTQSHAAVHKGQSNVEKAPLSDIIVKKTATKLTSAHSTQQLKDLKPQIKLLPMFSEIQLSEQQSHFIAKLEQCCYLCDWNNDSPATEQDRETKARYLKDVVTYVTNSKNVFPEAVWPSVMKMIQANIFRPFPIQDKGMFDLDDDEPNLDPAWAHLQFVYEILFRFVLSNEVDPKVAIRLFTPEFINNVIDLFDSEDARERDGLKSTLHRIYSRFWPRRPFIRIAISHKFHRVVYENIPFNGVAELLEILGSIIHGFGVPLKLEHKQFLQHTLLPLHKARSKINTFHTQLSNCMILFIEKDPSLARTIIPTLVHYWPKINSPKQVLFLTELEDIIDSLSLEELHPLAPTIFKKIAECIQTPQFQVAEKALSLLTNEYILQLVSQTKNQAIPVLFMALYANTKQHWNANVISLTFSALKLFMEMDGRLFTQCATSFKKKNDNDAKQRYMRDLKWQIVEKVARDKSPENYRDLYPDEFDNEEYQDRDDDDDDPNSPVRSLNNRQTTNNNNTNNNTINSTSSTNSGNLSPQQKRLALNQSQNQNQQQNQQQQIYQQLQQQNSGKLNTNPANPQTVNPQASIPGNSRSPMSSDLPQSNSPSNNLTILSPTLELIAKQQAIQTPSQSNSEQQQQQQLQGQEDAQIYNKDVSITEESELQNSSSPMQSQSYLQQQQQQQLDKDSNIGNQSSHSLQQQHQQQQPSKQAAPSAGLGMRSGLSGLNMGLSNKKGSNTNTNTISDKDKDNTNLQQQQQQSNKPSSQSAPIQSTVASLSQSPQQHKYTAVTGVTGIGRDIRENQSNTTSSNQSNSNVNSSNQGQNRPGSDQNKRTGAGSGINTGNKGSTSSSKQQNTGSNRGVTNTQSSSGYSGQSNRPVSGKAQTGNTQKAGIKSPNVRK